MSASPTVLPGAPYIYKLRYTLTAAGVAGDKYLLATPTSNNFIDFALGNVLSWVTVKGAAADDAASGIQLNIQRDGITVREIPDYVTQRNRQAPFPGFAINIPPGRLQFEAELTAALADATVIQVDLFLAAPPSGRG